MDGFPGQQSKNPPSQLPGPSNCGGGVATIIGAARMRTVRGDIRCIFVG